MLILIATEYGWYISIDMESSPGPIWTFFSTFLSTSIIQLKPGFSKDTKAFFYPIPAVTIRNLLSFRAHKENEKIQTNLFPFTF